MRFVIKIGYAFVNLVLKRSAETAIYAFDVDVN